jgi:hypothetical protein
MARGRAWILDPHSGGEKILPRTQELVKKRITEYAKKNYAGKFSHLEFKFRGALCYVDAFSEPDENSQPSCSRETKEEYMERLRNTPTHLVRIRHFGAERWSVAFYTYSNERYEPCILPSGDWFGTVEEAFDIGAIYLE